MLQLKIFLNATTKTRCSQISTYWKKNFFLGSPLFGCLKLSVKTQFLSSSRPHWKTSSSIFTKTSSWVFPFPSPKSLDYHVDWLLVLDSRMSSNVALALSKEALSPWGFSGGKEEPGGEAKASQVNTASTNGLTPLPTFFPDLKFLFPLHISSLLTTGQIYSLATCSKAIPSSSSPRRHVSEVSMEIDLLEVERSRSDHMSQPDRSQL